MKLGADKLSRGVPVKQSTLVGQVMDRIKELILEGSLQPNQRMPNEQQLAEMFAVGRSTIREALKTFQYLGLIEIRMGKGTYIRESSSIASESLIWSLALGKKDFSELIELRMVMEHEGLWHLMMLHGDDEEMLLQVVDLLKYDVQRMEDAIKRNSQNDRLEADYSFHGHIIHICRSALFDKLYKIMQKLLIFEIENAQADKKDFMEIPKSHQELIESIRRGNYEKTCEEFRDHIKDARNILGLRGFITLRDDQLGVGSQKRKT